MTWFPDSSRINCSMCTLICSLVTLATSYFFEKLPTPSRNYVPLIQIWSMVRISWKINLFVIIILHSVCDPVMGDHGEMYVPETLLPIYQNEIIPLCDICTPNQYEVELLTGSKVCSVSDAWTAMQWFHEQGVKTVALSSTDLGPADGLLAFVSHKSGEFLCNKKALYLPYIVCTIKATTIPDSRSRSPNRETESTSPVPETSSPHCFSPTALYRMIWRALSKTPSLRCNL